MYNNSLVLLGPTGWGTGVGPRRSFIVAVLGQALGAATSNMEPVSLGLEEFIYITALYLALSAAKISLPISVVSYAMSTYRVEAISLWLTSPLFAFFALAFCKVLKGGGGLSLPTLFVLMYLFGYNNLALFSHNLVTTVVAATIGTYMGLSYSRWVVDLVALRPRTTVSINLTMIVGALAASLIQVPLSFTLVAYSALLTASSRYKIRVIRIEKFIKAYIGIMLALFFASIFPFLKSLLQYLAPQAS
ncbi:MAG: hypothetical protein ACK4SY_07415 [Pyrobaculum sp.]